MRVSVSGLLAMVGLAFTVPCLAAQLPEEEQIFTTQCALCHQDKAAAAGTPNERAPTRAQLQQFAPEAVITALTTGKMQPQGAALTETQRRTVAEFATGKKVGAAITAVANRCAIDTPMRDPASVPGWNGHGNGPAATRFQDAKAGGITAADLPRLKLKWAFGYANVGAARAQPTLAGGRLFVASENAEVHALNPKTGCTYWTFKAQAGVRTAPSVSAYRMADGKRGYAVLFADGRTNVYGVDAQTGRQLWTTHVDDHPSAGITGSPVVYDGRLFIGVQGLSEEGRGSTGGYACCTFRGSLNALDVSTGKVLWKTYTIEESRPRAKNKDGVQLYGPAGGGIWSAPSVDVKRGVVYTATGNAYADPAQKMTNAVIAMDQKTGAVRWYKQLTVADNWAMGCNAKNPNNPACPETLGPDFDFSATPMLAKVGSRELVVIPQKSATAYALDPDHNGEVVWIRGFGNGSGLGGQWGGAADGVNFYTGTNDFKTDTPGGMTAISLADGHIVWKMPPQPLLCGQKRMGCGAGQGGAVTAIPGAVFSGAHDGGLRAYSTKDGFILWTFDANKEFPTVNGVKANGASMDGPG
ncbi:MAG TPA: PQQ-binding-like beta-propeller repeat protein, partial [Steroidobacteraceae bacterium]|nr:PQQ-binding-like beta-propeller repeat protein [Steroidobacteraceae bacterium]